MAKRRRSEVSTLAEGGEEVAATVEIPPLRRVTRSLTRDDSVPPPQSSEHPKKRAKKAKTSTYKEEDKPEVVNTEAGSSSAAASEKPTIIIEHCTQCRSFSKRAEEARAGLEQGFPGINVVVIPKKGKGGSFVIRREGEAGDPFVNLQKLKRPFKPMKDLDMEEVVADIIKRIQG